MGNEALIYASACGAKASAHAPTGVAVGAEAEAVAVGAAVFDGVAVSAGVFVGVAVLRRMPVEVAVAGAFVGVGVLGGARVAVAVAAASSEFITRKSSYRKLTGTLEPARDTIPIEPAAWVVLLLSVIE